MQTQAVKLVHLPRRRPKRVTFCDLCGARLVAANTNFRFKRRCIICATERGHREAELAQRRQTQIISGFKPSSFWKNEDN